MLVAVFSIEAVLFALLEPGCDLHGTSGQGSTRLKPDFLQTLEE